MASPARRAGRIFRPPRTFDVWQLWLGVGVVFHHSNLRLPAKLERVLCGLVVTPRMHGVHHSTARAERHSNWASGAFSLWDRLHCTFRVQWDAPQPVIGLPAAWSDDTVTARVMWALPFHGSEEAVGRTS